MALIQGKAAKGIIPILYSDCAGCTVAQRFTHSLTANPTAGDILELGCIPAGHRVVDVILDADDLDSNGSPTIAIDVGVMSGDFGVNDSARTCGAEFFSGSTAAQSGAIARPTLKTAFRVAPTSKDRSIGLKFTTASATFVAGTIGLTVISAPDA